MDIVISTVASVAATIITVLGAVYYLDRKIETNRREHSAEIKEVRQTSEAAHVAIRADLTDIKAQLAARKTPIPRPLAPTRREGELI